MQIFKAKVGYAILIPTVAINIACFAIPAMTGAPNSSLWILAGILIPTTALILYLFYGITYQIIGDRLWIKCGWIYNWDIHIMKIQSIKPTRNPWSSPAPSLDRIEIRYGRYDSVLISPENKEALVEALQAINPDIENIS
ncbi:MAG: PH domain-containing protein [Bacteroidota bacterium]